jgi:hypothetical protein
MNRPERLADLAYAQDYAKWLHTFILNDGSLDEADEENVREAHRLLQQTYTRTVGKDE